MRLMRIGILGGLILGRASAQSTCVNFPAGFIPFSSISYVTAANSNGDHLVVGVPAAGAVNPGIIGGSISPSSPLSKATLPVSVTFGTQTVTAAFAGLTPGTTGLYQINVTIPPSVPTGNQVPVTISAGGASSSGQTYMAIH